MTFRHYVAQGTVDSHIYETLESRADTVFEAIERIGANAQRRLALDCLFTKLGLLAGGAA